ncbi:Uncharacterised protein [Mycobacteroides abscessus subsp. abscessus]|nr:Uncharacterised protein [Mycobacteroides abscessus subsp. abscessus]
MNHPSKMENTLMPVRNRATGGGHAYYSLRFGRVSWLRI